MKKIVYSALIISLIAALVVVLKQNPVKVEAFTLKRVDFEETLSAEGRVRSRTKKVLHAFASGDLENFNVKQGEIVKESSTGKSFLGPKVTHSKPDERRRVQTFSRI